MPDTTILIGNMIDDAATTLAATNASSTAPIERVRRPHLSDAFAALTASTVIDIDLGSARAADQMFIAAIGDETVTGISSAAVTAGSTAGASDLASVTFGATVGSQIFDYDDHFAQALVDFGATITARYWRLALTLTGVTNLKIGRLFLAPVLPVTQNVGFPLVLDSPSRDQVERMEGGQDHVYENPAQRVNSYRFGVGSSEAMAFNMFMRSFRRNVGGNRQCVVTVEKAGAVMGVRQSLLGKVTLGPTAREADLNQREVTFQLTEAL